jgi:hypothetical protein
MPPDGLPMTAEALLEPSRVRDAASCRAWLERLAAARAGRLESVDRLWRTLEGTGHPTEQQLEIAEQARPAHLGEVETVLERIDPAAYPTPDRERAQLAAVLASLALARDVYRGIHVRLQEEAMSGGQARAGDDAAARPAAPAGRSASAVPAAALRSVIPLVRALDYQVRLLAAMQRLRLAIDTDEWETLCMLAEALRASTFLDTQMPDPAPLLGRPATSRALFVYPLLLRLAAPWSLGTAEFRLAARLARRWAGLVGFRLDEAAGAEADLRHGPALMLSERRTVRLVTRRLRRRLDERRRDLAAIDPKAAERLPAGLSPDAARQLLADLERRWCDPHIVQQVPDVPLGRMGLRFALPQADNAGADPQDRRPAALHAAATRAYIYGRFEHNTIIRQALDPRRPADALSSWAQGAQEAEWVSIERAQSVFETEAVTPGLELGGLAMVVAPRAETAGGNARTARAEAARGRMFGRVVSLGQRLPQDLRQPTRKRIGLNVWSGSPVVVGVRIGEFAPWQDALMLCPDPATGEPASLVMPAGAFLSAASATLREAMRERRIRLEELLDRTRQFDRVRFVPEKS